MKICKLCDKKFPWTEKYFHWCNKSRNKLHVYCKECKVAYVMAWKHGGDELKNFKKIKRPTGINLARIIRLTEKAKEDYKARLISTENLRKRLLPLYREKTESIVSEYKVFARL